MTSPVERISGPSTIDAPGKRVEGEHRLLHAPVLRGLLAGEAEVLELETGHHLRRQLRQRHADRLGHERDGAGSARVHLEDEELVVLDRELDVHQADDLQLARQRVGRTAGPFASMAGASVCGGITIAASPECTPANSMCSSMPPITEVSPSLMQSTSSSIASSRNLSISTGLPGITSNTCAHDRLELVLAVEDEHAAAAQHERRPHQHRVTDLGRRADRLGFRQGDAIRRLPELHLVEHRREELPVLRDLDALRRGADDVDAVRLQRAGEIQRRLAAELHDGADAALLLVDFQHVLERQRLEVEPVAGVVVGGDGLRVAS
jgi:hypothetical protein